MIFLTCFIFAIESFILISEPSTTTVQDPLYSYTIIQKSYAIADTQPFDSAANYIWVNGTSTKATF